MSKKNRPKRANPIRFFVDPDEFASLTFGSSVDQVAEIAGVNPATVRRWLAGSSPIPYAVAQLFRLRCRGVIGPEWEDWAFGADGLLYHPFWRRGFTGRELAGLWFECRQMVSLKARVKQMEKEKQRLAEELDRAGFYRRQVRLEAQMGLALMRVAG